MIIKMKKDYQQGGEIKIFFFFFWKKLVPVHSLITEDFTFDKGF